MPFQIRDETAGRNILYVDDANQMGLGSLPNGGQAITVQGQNFLSLSGTFGCGLMEPGSQASYEGTVVVPPSSSVAVSIQTAQLPTVTSGLTPTSISTTAVTFTNSTGVSVSGPYSIW